MAGKKTRGNSFFSAMHTILCVSIIQSTKNPLGYQHHKAALKSVARVRDAVLFDTFFL